MAQHLKPSADVFEIGTLGLGLGVDYCLLSVAVRVQYTIMIIDFLTLGTLS